MTWGLGAGLHLVPGIHSQGDPGRGGLGVRQTDRECSSAPAGLEMPGLPPGKDAKDASDA